MRIASDGDNQGATQAKGGSQGIDDSTGAAQVGPVGANAPVRVLNDGDNQGSGGTGGDGGGPPPGDTPDEGPPDRPIGPTEDGIDDVQAPQEDAGAGDTLASPGPVGAALSAGGGALPFTGLEVWILLVMEPARLRAAVSCGVGSGGIPCACRSRRTQSAT